MMEEQGALRAPVFCTTSTAHAATRKVSFCRRGICARCALRDDLTALLLTNPADPTTATRRIDVLCQADRPESIITWKRSAKIQALLTSSGQTPLSQDGLDGSSDTAGRAADHLRALLTHHGLLPHQDPYLNRFETWIASNACSTAFRGTPQPSISGASEQAQVPKARGSSPESGQAGTSTRTRSCFGFAASACAAHGTQPWTSASPSHRHQWSPTRSATGTRSPSS